MFDQELDTLAISTVRGLALDMPRIADSGHSGTALSLAPLGWLLYSRILHHSPEHPDWPNRDRLVLSNGHACVLLYALLHLCGYRLTLQDLKDAPQKRCTVGYQLLHEMDSEVGFGITRIFRISKN